MNSYKDPDKLVDIHVEGYEPFEVKEINDENIAIIHDDGKGILNVRAFGENLTVKVLSEDYQNGHYVIRVNGKNFKCQIETNLHLLIKELGFNKISKSKEKEIHAPMPGMVLNTRVNDGDIVTEGQVMLTLEAMKMENIIKAPHDGIVDKVMVSNGEKVDKNQLLIRLE